jgi:hypothetical protein
MDFCYIDYPSPPKSDYRYLSRTLGSLKYSSIIIMRLMHRNPGEHRVFPVDLATFESWVEKHKDYPHRLQYADETVVVVVMYPPHDMSANAIIQQILREADRKSHPSVPRVLIGTGCPQSFMSTNSQ